MRMNRSGAFGLLLAATLITVAALLAHGTGSADDATFVRLPDMSAPRAAHTGTLLADGRVLIAGGLLSPGTSGTTSTDIYDPAQRRFSPGPPMQTERALHAAAPLGDGDVLIVGGRRNVASAEVFDVRTTRFERTGSMHRSRSSAAAASTPAGDVWIVAGIGGADESMTTSTEWFDPESGEFRLGPDLPGSGVEDPIVHALADGAFLIFGWHAIDGESGAWPSVLRWGPGDDRVRLVAQLRDDTVSHGASAATELRVAAATTLKANPITATRVADGRFLVTSPGAAWWFDPDGGTISRVVPADGFGRAETATALPDGRVLLTAYDSAPGAETARACLFDPATESFTDLGTVPGIGSGHTATGLRDGSVLLAGGQDGGEAVAAAALFTAGPERLPGSGSGVSAGRTADRRSRWARRRWRRQRSPAWPSRCA